MKWKAIKTKWKFNIGNEILVNCEVKENAKRKQKLMRNEKLVCWFNFLSIQLWWLPHGSGLTDWLNSEFLCCRGFRLIDSFFVRFFFFTKEFNSSESFKWNNHLEYFSWKQFGKQVFRLTNKLIAWYFLINTNFFCSSKILSVWLKLLNLQSNMSHSRPTSEIISSKLSEYLKNYIPLDDKKVGFLFSFCVEFFLCFATILFFVFSWWFYFSFLSYSREFLKYRNNK